MDNGLSLDTTVSASANRPEVADDGRERQQVTLELDQRLTARGEAELGRAGVSGEIFTGRAVSYTVTAAPGHLGAGRCLYI